MADANQEMDPRELMAQLQYLQQLYSQQYQALEDNIATYTIAQSALQRNIELMDKAGSVGNSGMLIDGGGGTYFDAKVGNMKRVLVYVGAGFIVEKSPGDAKAFLKDNESKGDEVLRRLAAEKQKVENELIEIAYRMNALQQQYSGR